MGPVHQKFALLKHLKSCMIQYFKNTDVAGAGSKDSYTSLSAAVQAVTFLVAYGIRIWIMKLL